MTVNNFATYLLLLFIVMIFCVVIWWLAEWVIRLRDANEEMDRDLADAEEQLREHAAILRDLEVMRRKLESVPARITAIENRTRVLRVDEEDDDVVYATS